MTDQFLYSRKQAAAALSLSVSSIDTMIGRGMLRTVRKGRRVMIYKTELDRVARQNLPSIWPPKRDGKTTRRAAA